MPTYTYRLNMASAEEQWVEGVFFKKATNINYITDQLFLNKWVPAKLDKWVDGVLHNSDNELPHEESLQETANIRDIINSLNIPAGATSPTPTFYRDWIKNTFRGLCRACWDDYRGTDLAVQRDIRRANAAVMNENITRIFLALRATSLNGPWVPATVALSELLLDIEYYKSLGKQVVIALSPQISADTVTVNPATTGIDQRNLPAFWDSVTAIESYSQAVADLALTLKGNVGVAAIEIVNEPMYTSSEVNEWSKLSTLYQLVIDKVRLIDSSRVLILSNGGESIARRMKNVTPLNDPFLVYNFHFYEPTRLGLQVNTITFTGGISGNTLTVQGIPQKDAALYQLAPGNTVESSIQNSKILQQLTSNEGNVSSTTIASGGLSGSNKCVPTLNFGGNFGVGMFFLGTNIPTGTQITALNTSTNEITLSNSFTGNATGTYNFKYQGLGGTYLLNGNPQTVALGTSLSGGGLESYPNNSKNFVNTSKTYSRYIDVRGNATGISRYLADAIEFKDTYNVPVIVTEFGSSRRLLGDSSRLLFKDQVEALEANGIHWLGWGDFSIYDPMFQVTAIADNWSVSDYYPWTTGDIPARSPYSELANHLRKNKFVLPKPRKDVIGAVIADFELTPVNLLSSTNRVGPTVVLNSTSNPRSGTTHGRSKLSSTASGNYDICNIYPDSAIMSTSAKDVEIRADLYFNENITTDTTVFHMDTNGQGASPLTLTAIINSNRNIVIQRGSKYLVNDIQVPIGQYFNLSVRATSDATNGTITVEYNEEIVSIITNIPTTNGVNNLWNAKIFHGGLQNNQTLDFDNVEITQRS